MPCVWLLPPFAQGHATLLDNPEHLLLQGNSALHHAARGGHKGVVTLLVRCAGLRPGCSARSRSREVAGRLGLLAHHPLVAPPCALVIPTHVLCSQKASPNTRNFNKSEYASGSWLRCGLLCLTPPGCLA